MREIMRYVGLYEKAKAEGRLKTLTPRYLEFRKRGDRVVGVFRGSSMIRSSMGDGEYCQYLVETDVGMVNFALGKATDREIKGLLLEGHLYGFVFQGKEKLQDGKSVNKFLIHEVGQVAQEGDGSPDDIPF